MANRKTKKDNDNVVPFPARDASRASEKKWGKKVMERGFCIVPSLLFKAQARLKINAAQLAVLMHLADHWWEADRRPWPAKKTIADRLGLSPRQVQRYMAELEEMGYVKRIERRARHRGKLSNEYDLTGLVDRLKELEPEFREVDQENEARRRGVARPGLRRRAKSPA